MTELKCVFFDVGCTLVDESAVWKKRCEEQSEMKEAKSRGISAKQIYEEIIKASKEYKPQYRTVVKNLILQIVLLIEVNWKSYMTMLIKH